MPPTQWNVGRSGSFKVSVGPAALAAEKAFEYSVGVGGVRGWGGHSRTQITQTEAVQVTLPGKSGSVVTMEATKSKQEVPYEATVRVRYDDGTTRNVTDRGTYVGVVVTDFVTKVGKSYKL